MASKSKNESKRGLKLTETETLAATALGSLALAGWLDAKFHIRNDLRTLIYGRSQRDAQNYIAEKVQQDRLLMYQILEDQVKSPAIANNVFLISAADGRTWTYKEFLQDVNKVGNWLLQELDIQKQELVALDGLNSPEYLIAWFALDSIGAAPCFINHSLTGQSLEHYIMQYVGELCRYLVNAKPHPLEREHKLKMAWGNGMRPDVWEPFRQRFGIPTIHELYAASDGMGAMYNPNRGEFSRHAIGVRGLLWNVINGSREKMVKIDVDTQEIIRDPKTGFATECPRGVPGETIHWVDPANPYAQFEGYYKNQEATNKRFIRDVFKKGDMWFRSGDMMRQDSNGCVYFVDRLGDTYRWKSENVSTNEVSDLLGQFPGIAECNVYGVLVPNADGRAGCAAIVFSDGLTADAFDFKGLAEHSLRRMPRYAVPIFLRITHALGYTSTMKLQKGKLRQEGCDVAKAEASGDTMYWLPPNATTYVPFTQEAYQKVKSGEIQL
ncbi:hypothetical protein ATERTT37_001284 [Aspergillus terreus]